MRCSPLWSGAEAPQGPKEQPSLLTVALASMPMTASRQEASMASVSAHQSSRTCAGWPECG
eukprot:2042302-Lingulodinium_polyedra.AAC.1